MRGIKIREATANDGTAIALVQIESWRTTYKGIVPADYLAAMQVKPRAEWWSQNLGNPERNGFGFVAEDESERMKVIGFASGGPERENDPVYTGEFYALHLLASHQRRGIGGTLMRAGASRLIEQGHKAMLLWVLAQNPSRRFYEALGGEYLRTKQIEIGGVILDEVAYGWKNLNTLINGKEA